MDMQMSNNFRTMVRTLLMSSDAAFNTAYTTSHGISTSYAPKVFGPLIDLWGRDFADGLIYSGTYLQGWSLDCLSPSSEDMDVTFFSLFNGETEIPAASFTCTLSAIKYDASNSERLVFTVSWTNTTNENKTFDKIEMLKRLQVKKTIGGTNYTNSYFELGSCTLDTPETIAPNETKIFEIAVALPTLA